MTTRYTLSENVWTRITDPYEDGTCWRVESAAGYVVLEHTVLPQGDTIDVGSQEETDAGINQNKGFPLKALDTPIVIPPDFREDVYYALIVAAASSVLIVDVK